MQLLVQVILFKKNNNRQIIKAIAAFIFNELWLIYELM